MKDEHSGACLCGAVRFTTRGRLRGIVYCHCTQCRKQTGHFYAATNVADERLTVTGAEKLTWFHASGDARRGFCSVCGSALFWKLEDSNVTSVLAGAFDKPTGLVGEAHIFVLHKGDYYKIDDGLPRFERSTGSVEVAGD